MGGRWEIQTTGIDDALQGITCDPYGGSVPTSLGLRIPSPIGGTGTGPRFLFQLASMTLQEGGKAHLVGLRQLLTLGMDFDNTGGVAPTFPIELDVTTSMFRFTDGNVSWHLVKEPIVNYVGKPTDAPNFRFQSSDTPALVYESATFSAGTNPITGAPAFYFLNMTAYAPPTPFPGWQPIAGLGNLKGMIAPWSGGSSIELDEIVEGPCRISVYASILQTQPDGRGAPSFLPMLPLGSVGFLSPEWNFIVQSSTTDGAGHSTAGPQYWRVGASLIFDDIPNDVQDNGPGGEV